MKFTLLGRCLLKSLLPATVRPQLCDEESEDRYEVNYVNSSLEEYGLFGKEWEETRYETDEDEREGRGGGGGLPPECAQQ